MKWPRRQIDVPLLTKITPGLVLPGSYD